MTGAFIVNRRAAILRVLLYLAITFTLGFAAGRVSASESASQLLVSLLSSGSASGSAAKAIPATSSGSRGESNTLTAERAAHSRLLEAERSVPVILGGGAERDPGVAQWIEHRTIARFGGPEVAGSNPVSGVKRSALLRGTASWYPANGLIAAVHSWRWGNRPYIVRVCAARCVVVWVQDYCAGCTGSRLIDLSDDAFWLLAPLSQGIVKVTVTR